MNKYKLGSFSIKKCEVCPTITSHPWNGDVLLALVVFFIGGIFMGRLKL